ncbi:MAG: hypothetical protein D3917_02650 [Candidatus Electrothrix sp. AX5]|nr:hypothetical protein [Candidatus Electrothrix sp. AX5]
MPLKTEKKHVLVLAYSFLDRDPRVRRQLVALRKKYRITAAGFTDPMLDGVDFIQIGTDEKWSTWRQLFRLNKIFKRLQLYQLIYWDAQKKLDLARLKEGGCYDAVLANDVDTLPVAFALVGKKRVLADVHEYSPRQFTDNPLWIKTRQPMLTFLCRHYLGKAEKITTVCESIAREYEREFKTRPIDVLRNCAPYYDLNPQQHQEKLRIIHHGISSPSRKIENMIKVMDFVDNRFTLDLMLVNTSDAYYAFLQKEVEKRKNVRLIDPVSVEDIIPFSNAYDIGFFLAEAITYNLKVTLPNKIFEFIQARLALAVGVSIEMRNLVDKHQCGVGLLSVDPQKNADVLNALTAEDIAEFKKNSNSAAKEESFENERAKLFKILDPIVDGLDSSC